MEYTYISPRDRGYVPVKGLSWRERKTLLPYRKQSILTKQEWWISEDAVEIQFLTNILGKIVITLAFPFLGIMHGFFNKELYVDYIRTYREKKYGAFSSDKVFKHNNPDFYEYVKSKQK